MKRRDVRAWLFDIIDAGEYITSITADKDFPAFVAERGLRQLVERNLEIIGEAVVALIRAEPSFEAKITQTRQIIGLRNRLIHAYFDVDPTALWNIVQTDLPRLLTEASSSIRQYNATEEQGS